MKILLRRWGALGDVIMTTPIVRRLRRENPDAEIVIQTLYPDVFRNSPHNVTCIQKDTDYDTMIDLTNAYEMHPTQHVVEAYMWVAFDDPGDPRDRQQEIVLPKPTNILKAKECVAVHAAQAGWANRTLPSETWILVCAGLREAGLWPILVGSEHDALPQAKATNFHVPDLIVQTSLISNCAAFVGSDSSLLHAAGATATPIVGVFTSVRAAYRLPWRNGVPGGNCIAIEPDLDCIGCQARAPVPTTTEVCERGDIACVRSISAARIVQAVLEITNEILRRPAST